MIIHSLQKVYSSNDRKCYLLLSLECDPYKPLISIDQKNRLTSQINLTDESNEINIITTTNSNKNSSIGEGRRRAGLESSLVFSSHMRDDGDIPRAFNNVNKSQIRFGDEDSERITTTTGKEGYKYSQRHQQSSIQFGQ